MKLPTLLVLFRSITPSDEEVRLGIQCRNPDCTEKNRYPRFWGLHPDMDKSERINWESPSRNLMVLTG